MSLSLSSSLETEKTSRITLDKKVIVCKESLYSRIINQSSHNRHFVKWYEQNFILSDYDITIIDKDGKEFIAKLDNSYIKSHHYLPIKDRIYKDSKLPILCLYISQFNIEKKVYIETEINIQFKTIILIIMN